MLTTTGLTSMYLGMSTPSHTISLLVKWRQTEKCKSSRWLRAATQRMLSWVSITFWNYPKVVYKALRIGCSTSVYSPFVVVQSSHCTIHNITLLYPHTVETIVPLFFIVQPKEEPNTLGVIERAVHNTVDTLEVALSAEHNTKTTSRAGGAGASIWYTRNC